MRPVPVTLLLLAVGLLQAVAVWDRPDALVRPDLLLITSVAFALGFPLRRAIPVAFAAGLLRDIHSVAPFGVSALTFSLVACAVALVRDEIYREHPITHVLLTALVAWIPVGGVLAPTALAGGWTACLPILPRAAVFVAHTALFAPLLVLPLLAAAPLWAERPSYLEAPEGA